MYSAAVLSRFHEPKFSGLLESPTHSGTAGTPGDGPYMQLSLVVREGTVIQAGFDTYGCPSAVACGSLIAELAIGRDLTYLTSISPRDLILLLGGLPEGKEHCADLAVGALRAAIEHKEIIHA